MKRLFAPASVTASAVIVALLATYARTASADDGAVVLGRVQTAMLKVKSFTISMTGTSGSAAPGGAQSFSGETTVVLPDLSRAVARSGTGGTFEIVMTGKTVYERHDGGAWSARTMSEAPPARSWIETSGQVTILPDRSESGETVGVLSIASVLPAGNGTPPVNSTTVCTYAKTTYLPRVCTVTVPATNAHLVRTYGKWNDPHNVVAVPADAGPPQPFAEPAHP